MLAWSGCEAAEAADGTEGFAKAESPHPDMILLDARMRGLDGYEVCRRLKANPATTHTVGIFLTKLEGVAQDHPA